MYKLGDYLTKNYTFNSHERNIIDLIPKDRILTTWLVVPAFYLINLLQRQGGGNRDNYLKN